MEIDWSDAVETWKIFWWMDSVCGAGARELWMKVEKWTVVPQYLRISELTS
jgi:hypothetical protein